MSTPNSAIEQAHTATLVVSESGLQQIDHNPQILEIAAQYADQASFPEKIFNKQNYDYLGAGENSVVWGLGDIAIKVSSPTTGRKALNITGDGFDRLFGLRPENLVDQFLFLDALDDHLREVGSDGIVVPKQYLALRSLAGNYLRVEQRMHMWSSLYDLSSRNGWHKSDTEKRVVETVKARLASVALPRKLKLAIDDFNLGNFMAPKDIANIEEVSVCIIDQPGKSFLGRVAMKFVNSSSGGRNYTTLR